MNEAIINGELAISYPEGFHVMGEAEQASFFLADVADRWGIWDTDRHIVITLYWHKSSRFWVRLSSPKDQAKRIEAKARKTYKANGYRCLGFSEARIAGRNAHTVSFECRIQGVEHVVDVIVFQDKDTCYFTYFYAHKESAAESRDVLEGVLASYRLPSA